MVKTPINPTMIALHRQMPTRSPKKRIESRATKIGDENMIAAVIVRERYLTAMKLKNVDTTKINPRKINSVSVLRSSVRMTDMPSRDPSITVNKNYTA